MTSSRSDARADNAVGRILVLLDESRVRGEIDNPIDAAAETFVYDEGEAASHQKLHQVLASFVQHVFRNGPRPPQELSLAQAGAEAIALLETGYSSHASGYDAALVDAMNPRHDGVNLVLAQLAEIIKVNERRKYTQWVFASALEPLTWAQKCRVAEVLLDHLRPFLPPEMRCCVAAQVVDELPALILAHHSGDALLRHASALANSLLGT